MKKITISLDTVSIASAIAELHAYERDLKAKCQTLRERVAELIADQAASGFNASVVDHTINAGRRNANVSVNYESNGDVTLVIASGEDAVWVEFGTGVYYNGAAGSSPHPKGAELGYTIGGYGKGNGRKRIWAFYEGGQLIRTRGTPATMPLYKATMDVIGLIADIAKEVFA